MPISARVTAHLRHEGGFGMLELLIALVVLNVGLFALVGAFNASTISINRARNATAAVALVDQQMETYRGLANCAIWLDQWLMPASGTTYANYAPGYNGNASFTPQVAYWNAGAGASTQSWATDGMTSSNSFSQSSLASCAYTGMSTSATLPLTSTTGSAANLASLNTVTPPISSTNCSTTVTSTPCPVKPTQTVIGPDGQRYTLDTYIILVQPQSGQWSKQVTVLVRDPKNSTRILARETAVFDPAVG
jgi:type II secretory pathway pseudopilin PulG